MSMRDIWIPHIPKNAGKTIILNVREHCQKSLHFENNFDHAFVEDIWYHARNHDTRRKIRLDHGTVYETELKDWLNILVIRDPFDRFVSWYNWSKWLSWLHNKKVNNLSMDQFIELGCGNKEGIKNPHGPWFASRHIGHLQFLNMQQGIYGVGKDSKKRFTIKNVTKIFEYIIDVSNIKKVFSLVEENFLGRKIKWEKRNTDQQALDRLNDSNVGDFKLFKRENLSKKQLDRIHDVRGFKEDLDFYKNVCHNLL